MGGLQGEVVQTTCLSAVVRVRHVAMHGKLGEADMAIISNRTSTALSNCENKNHFPICCSLSYGLCLKEKDIPSAGLKPAKLM